MDGVRSNKIKADSASSTALIDLARLLARQAAREWLARQPDMPDINDAAMSHAPPSEKRS